MPQEVGELGLKLIGALSIIYLHVIYGHGRVLAGSISKIGIGR